MNDVAVSHVKSVGNVLMYLVALVDLGLCALAVVVGMRHQVLSLGFAFMGLAAAGITVGAIRYYLAASADQMPRKAQDVIGTLFAAVGFAVLAFGYLLVK
jgi:hypothetical protein